MTFVPEGEPPERETSDPGGLPPETDEPLLPFVWAKDVTDGQDDTQEILEDILTAGAMSVWYGESNSGKTWCCSTSPKPSPRASDWLGKRTTQGCVIYEDAEGAKTIERRIRAIRLTDSDLQDDYPLGVVKTGINMCSSAADTELLAKLAPRKG